MGIGKTNAGGSGGLSMELLWQNGKPGDEFGSQTIPLDLYQYDAIAVSFWFHTSYVETFAPKMWLAFKGHNAVGFTVYGNDDASGLMYREFDCDNNGVSFKTGHEVGKAVLNEGAIPHQIYGIRFSGGASA